MSYVGTYLKCAIGLKLVHKILIDYISIPAVIVNCKAESGCFNGWLCFQLSSFAEFNHIFCDFGNSIPQGFWGEDLNLVAVAEYPPAYFAEAVHPKFNDGRAVVFKSNLLRDVKEK